MFKYIPLVTLLSLPMASIADNWGYLNVQAPQARQLPMYEDNQDRYEVRRDRYGNDRLMNGGAMPVMECHTDRYGAYTCQ